MKDYLDTTSAALPPPIERIEELMALRLVGMISDEEIIELTALEARYPLQASLAKTAQEKTAEAVWDSVAVPMDDLLRQKLEQTAWAELGQQRISSRMGRGSRHRTIIGFGGWLAAACLLVALLVNLRAVSESRLSRETLLTAGTTPIQWQATGSMPQASGDVVWSDQRQAGFMRLVHVTPNNPSVSQYQLWVFDANRPESTPVDGGVFNVSTDGEVIVPIHTKLAVSKAVLFAITEEPPGGVVVSDRSKLHLVAKVP